MLVRTSHPCLAKRKLDDSARVESDVVLYIKNGKDTLCECPFFFYNYLTDAPGAGDDEGNLDHAPNSQTHEPRLIAVRYLTLIGIYPMLRLMLLGN